MYPVVIQDAVSEVCIKLSIKFPTLISVRKTSVNNAFSFVQSADECVICRSPFSDSCQQPQLKLFRPTIKQVSCAILIIFCHENSLCRALEYQPLAKEKALSVDTVAIAPSLPSVLSFNFISVSFSSHLHFYSSSVSLQFCELL